MATRARRAGMAMGAAAIVLGTGLYKAGKSAVELDNNMRKVQARITGIKPEGLKMLTEEAVRLGGSTRYTIGQVSSLMATMAQAGIGVNGIKQMSGAMLDFATATGVTLDEASAIATRTANAYGLSHNLENIQKVTDSLTYATINAQLNITQLGEAMEYTSKTSKDYNQTIDTTAAMLAFLGNVGITGSKAGTTLNALYREMAQMDGGVLKVNGSFIKLTNSIGDLRQLPQIFAQVSKAMEGMGGLEKAAAMQDLFGRLGIKGGIVGADNYEAIQKMTDEMQNIDGLTKKVALTMDAGIGGTLYRLVSAFDALAVTIGNAIIPYVDIIAKTLSQWAIVVTDLIAGFNWIGGVLAAVFLGLAGGAVSLLAFAGVTTVLATTFASISTIVSGLISTIAAIATPIGLIVTGVVAILGTFTAVLASFYEWENLLKNITSITGELYRSLNDAFGYAIKAARIKEFELAWKMMTLGMKKALFTALNDMLGTGWKPWFVMIRGWFRTLSWSMKTLLKSAVAVGMGIAAAMRGDGVGAAEWMAKYKGITNKEKMTEMLNKWRKSDYDVYQTSDELDLEITKLEELIDYLKKAEGATTDLNDAAKKTRFEELAADYVAQGSQWFDFPQSSNED
ncbi:MAG: phage tail tape measure protein, partial [Opitutae bacterium]|nr:phage tail tape measure protein [Opitutae bacterium]